MHTVRNRLASRPPVAMPFAAGGKGPNHPAKRHELAPTQRGSMAVPLVVPDESGLIEERPRKRRNPKGKKARKAATRLAQVRDAAMTEIADDKAPTPVRKVKLAQKTGAKKGKAKTEAKTPRGTAPRRAARKAVQPEQLPAIPSPPLLEQRLAGLPKLIAPEPEPQAFILPDAREPLVEPFVLAESEALPAQEPLSEPEPAAALAEAPLPRSLALVPARRQGLIDVIAFLLRDSGRRLARWSARRRKSRTEQAALRRAEARQINLQRELEALDALRRHKG